MSIPFHRRIDAHTIHVWYSYLHLVDICSKLVRKYTDRPMEPKNPESTRGFDCLCLPRTRKDPLVLLGFAVKMLGKGKKKSSQIIVFHGDSPW